MPFQRFLAVVVLLLSSVPAHAAEFTLWPLPRPDFEDAGIGVLVDGKLFAEYWPRSGAKPILWPIHGPSGVEMSRQYPMKLVDDEKHDHPHQRSLWFTHGDVNGVDFWTEFDRHGRIVQREIVRQEAGQGQAVIATINDWLDPDGKKLLEDERTMTFRADGEVRTIDYDITLKASDGPVVFGDTKEGSLGIRVPTTLDVEPQKGKTHAPGEGGHIVNAEGVTNAEAWGKPSAWVDYYGPAKGKTVGVAIFQHPLSFGYPARWHVRGYGLFAANPFGVAHFEPESGKTGGYTLPAGESIQLRFRFVFHDGDVEAAKIADLYQAYAGGQ